jgi:hypothetical protein
MAARTKKPRLTRSEVLTLPDEAMLDEQEVSVLTHLSIMSFRRYRIEGCGPSFEAGKRKSSTSNRMLTGRGRIATRRMRWTSHKRQHAA